MGLVRERQIVGIYVLYVCGAWLHFRIGFSVIIDVFYSDAMVAQPSVLPLSYSTAVHCPPPPHRPRLSFLPVVRQILRSPGTPKRMLSRSCGCRAATEAATADLLRYSAIYSSPRKYRISLSENLTRNPPPTTPTLLASRYFTVSQETKTQKWNANRTVVSLVP